MVLSEGKKTLESEPKIDEPAVECSPQKGEDHAAPQYDDGADAKSEYGKGRQSLAPHPKSLDNDKKDPPP